MPKNVKALSHLGGLCLVLEHLNVDVQLIPSYQLLDYDIKVHV